MYIWIYHLYIHPNLSILLFKKYMYTYYSYTYIVHLCLSHQTQSNMVESSKCFTARWMCFMTPFCSHNQAAADHSKLLTQHDELNLGWKYYWQGQKWTSAWISRSVGKSVGEQCRKRSYKVQKNSIMWIFHDFSLWPYVVFEVYFCWHMNIKSLVLGGKLGNHPQVWIMLEKAAALW